MHAPNILIPLAFLAISTFFMVSISHAYTPEAEMFLKSQNELRGRVGSPPLAWNESLADKAHDIAITTSCDDPSTLEDSPPDQINFFSKKFNTKDANVNFFNTLDWESYAYVSETNSCPDNYPCSNFPKMACLHTTGVGCSSAPCGVGTLIVCLYYMPPPPEFVDHIMVDTAPLVPVSDANGDL